jgi:hypothetical protein
MSISLNNKPSRKTKKPSRPRTRTRKNKSLQEICPDSNSCLIFNKNYNQIMSYFDELDSNLVNRAIKLNTKSVQCMIHEVTFNKNNYEMSAILKIPTTSKSWVRDNLWYEYVVGLYLNTIKNYIPIFIETYKLFIFKNIMRNEFFTKINRGMITFDNNFNDFFVAINDDIENSLRYPSSYSLMIENIKNSRTLGYYMNELNELNDSIFFHRDLPAILFIVYFSLFTMYKNNKTFVHYDLHIDNVLLYSENDKLFEYRFHTNGRVITIKTRYLVKVIDYSSSYFENTPSLYEEILETFERKRISARETGLFKPKLNVTYDKPNISHDIRLLNNIKIFKGIKQLEPRFESLIKNVVYDGNGTTKCIEDVDFEQDKIRNIVEAYNSLYNYILSKSYRKIQNKYKADEITKLIDIYDDLKTPVYYI